MVDNSRFFGQFLLIGDRTLDGFEEVVLRLQNISDVVHPFAMLFVGLGRENEAKLVSLWIGRAQQELSVG